MSTRKTETAYGTLIEPATVKIERRLPGPIERVWAYLTESDLRRQWLASGVMEMKVGTPFEFTWRNSELSADPGQRPPGASESHSLACEITACDPPRKLAITWGRSGGVVFELEQQGSDVLLTLVHHRLPDRDLLLKVSAGWHAHLDVLVARLAGAEPAPFWNEWLRLHAEYAERIPG